jgi:hypothetical protein
MRAQSCPEARAKDLLRRILPESQWERFSETETIEVAGSRGTYRICTGDLTRLLDAKTRRPRAGACLQLTVPAPVHDRIIAEYLLIQNDEDLYWQTANIFPVNPVLAEFLVAAVDALLLILLFAELYG